MLSIRNVWREWSWPERAVLLAVAVVHGIALTWGLPASDGWDVDGIAPRDFLPGLIATFTPGDHFTYPPFHLALLGLLTLPVSVVEITRVPSHAPADVVAAFTAVPIMTIFAVVARLVSFGMSLAVVVMVGRFAERIFGRAARSWAMAVCGVEVAGTYYAHTTNLDLPALFWSMLAFDVLARAILADDPKRLRRVGLFVAFAIATKDQAYAIAALTLPFAVIAWSRRSDKPVLREGILTALLVVFLVLAIDGALVNPSGFAARVRFLTGPASQDFAQHSKDWAGRTSAFVDALLFFPMHYPVLLAPILLAGVVVAVRRTGGRERIVAALPIVAALSFTLTFNCVARRVEERFLLPQMQLVAVYGGVLALAPAWGRIIGVVSLLLGLRGALDIDVMMLHDARYDAERFIAASVPAGDTIEVYGNNVYLPRLPPDRAIQRIGRDDPRRRSPLPGVTETKALLGAVDQRRPQWIVVPTGFAWRYLQEDPGADHGRVLPKTQQAELADADTRDYVRALFAEETDYRLSYRAHDPGSWLFPAHGMHASLATDVLVFRRSGLTRSKTP